MIIGIDARMLGPKAGGLGRYIQELLNHVLRIDTENTYIVFLRKENWDLVPEGNSQVKKVLADIPWYSWKEQVFLPSILKKHPVDLMHFPHWNIPLLYTKPFVVTIHDLTMYHYPRGEASTHGRVVYWIKNLLSHVVVKHAVRKARKILVPTEFTRQDVRKTLGMPMEKMVVTYLAPFTKSSSISPTLDLNKNRIHKPYVLYVGVAFPHKNLEGLLKAWNIFEHKYGSEYQLVLAGKKNYFYNRLLELPLMEDLQHVIYTDFVPDEELPCLYKQASLFVFPSLYEGFGLPPLEAMQYGVPVVSSNRSCLPEVLGEAALYVDPENYEQMADMIYLGLTNHDIRFELQRNAKEELKRYSWERTARQTLEAYRK